MAFKSFTMWLERREEQDHKNLERMLLSRLGFSQEAIPEVIKNASAYKLKAPAGAGLETTALSNVLYTTHKDLFMKKRHITVYKGGAPALYRWYAYDADGVKLTDGPLNYQDYDQGEKTKIQLQVVDKGKVALIKFAPK